MLRTTLFIFIGFLANFLTAQPFFEDLHGFRLGQLKECTYKQLGDPMYSGLYSDTVEFETFSISPDSSFRITFTYLPREVQKIHSIEVFGFSDEVVFNGLSLGDKEELIKKIAGKPAFKATQEYPIKGERWEYWQSNFVLQTTIQNRLYSVKIKDITPELYTGYTREIIPKFSRILQAFSSGDRKMMLEYLAPDFVAEFNGGRFYFAAPIQQEIMTDTSHVFALLTHPDAGIPALLKAKKGDILEKLVFDKQKPPVLIYKCADSFKIKELELIYHFGSYRIHRIRYRE